jgi:protein-S-isoprenylcysteine O-methyltransferase Ste14
VAGCAAHNGLVAHLLTWICWGLVVAVWIVGAVAGARGPRGKRSRSDAATAWQLAAFVVAVVVFRLVLHDVQRVEDHSWALELPGLVLLLASTGFTLWARLSLGRMWSASPNVLQAHHELRTDGPYAVTRHPIYTGMLGMLVGTVLLNGLGISLAFLVLGVAFVAGRIPVEERLMTATFPDEYPRYRRRVPRIVPGAQLLRRSH